MRRSTTHYKREKPLSKPVDNRVIFTLALLALLLTASLAYCLPILIRPSTPTNEYIYDWPHSAEVAWRYFQPEVGVNPATGLNYANANMQRLTDWDLGTYISAIINAERLGLIPRNGQWGSNLRLEKILSFLETRPITSDRLPYAQYDAETGTVADDVDNQTAYPSDSANLLLALDDLRSFRPDLSRRIGSIVARYNFEMFAQSDYFATDNMYPFYLAQGYEAFGFQTPKLRDLKDLGEGNTVNVYGENIPKAWVTSEPLVLAILEDRTNDLYKAYADSVFLAQQTRYELTGKLTAFGEGGYLASNHKIDEWIMTDTGKPWVTGAGDFVKEPEVVCTKIAFAFHAAYDNEYTQELVNHVFSLATEKGFLEGITENGKIVNTLSGDTNCMIMQAAHYTMLSKPTLVSLAPKLTFPRYAITTFVVSPDRIEEQLQLLRAIGACNVTLVCRESEHDKFQLVYNAFKDYSDCIIPEFSFMQTLKPEWRVDVVNARFNEFKLSNGSYPSGVFSFQLDTFTLNYVKAKFNVSFAVGNVWDQVNLDSMSLRGGFSTPYYASQSHNLIPAKTQDNASVLVIPPFATAPTDRYHFDNNHLIDLYTHGVDIEEFKYVSLNHPFFAPFFLELDWLINQNSTDILQIFVENYRWVYKNFNVVTAEQFARIFELRFPTTPEYHFTYTSSNLTTFPETQGWKIEWFMSPYCRLARVGDKVVSALNYSVQNEDPFLASNKSISFTGFRFGEDENNMLYTDLSFRIDDLWQSEFGDRTLKQTGYAVYTGNLEDFTLTFP